MVTAPAPLERRGALATEAKASPVLRARGQGHGRLAINGWDLNLGTEQGFEKRDRYLAQDIIALACKIGVRPHSCDDIQIPRRATVSPRLAFPSHPHFRTGIHPRGDFDLQTFHAPITPRHLHV